MKRTEHAIGSGTMSGRTIGAGTESSPFAPNNTLTISGAAAETPSAPERQESKAAAALASAAAQRADLGRRD